MDPPPSGTRLDRVHLGDRRKGRPCFLGGSDDLLDERRGHQRPSPIMDKKKIEFRGDSLHPSTDRSPATRSTGQDGPHLQEPVRPD